MSTEYMIIELASERFAIPVHAVLSLLKHEQAALHQPFGQQEAFSGYVQHQGAVIPVVDLRRSLGMRSMAEETEEFVDTLSQRKQDHINWLDELEASVREDRPFGLTTDPHGCKFGKWYDALLASPEQIQRFTNGNGSLDGVLRAFDAPHQRIHAIAVEVEQHKSRGDRAGAIRIVDRSRDGDLKTMISLFDRASELLTSLRRTLLLVLEHGGEHLGAIIDQVHGLGSLTDEHTQNIRMDSPLVRAMALPAPDARPVAILDVAALYNSARVAA